MIDRLLSHRTWLVLALLCLAPFARAQLTLDLTTGVAAKAPTYVDLAQRDQRPVRIDGVRFDTRPFTSLLLPTDNYYDVRIGYFPPGSPDLGVELELLHDKAYYAGGDDPGGVLQALELTDGVSFLTLNGVARTRLDASDAYPQGRWQLLARGGAGPVVVKPASTVRSLEDGYDTAGTLIGYRIGGLGVQLGAQARYQLLPWLAASVEVKFTYADIDFAIAEGFGRTSLVGQHLLVGVSIGF